MHRQRGAQISPKSLEPLCSGSIRCHPGAAATVLRGLPALDAEAVVLDAVESILHRLDLLLVRLQR